jgi:chromosome segregation ATPase
VGTTCVALVAAALLLTASPRGADLDAIEKTVREARDARAHLVEERTRRMGEAAVLADEIARQKAGNRHPTRADRKLEGALRHFDRIARALDEVDRRIAGQDRTIANLERKFDEAANAAVFRLTGTVDGTAIGEVARELDAIDQAKRRVAGMGTADPAFRPVLEVTLSPDDGAVEVQQKLGLLESERGRVQKGIAQLDADAKVLSARMRVKRRLSTVLEDAARTKGAEPGLLRRESETVADALHDLDAQREALARQRADLSEALAQVERRLEELRAALRAFGPSKGDVR